jgi:PKD repeat protein
MKNRCFTVVLLLTLLVALPGNAQARITSQNDPIALVYVDLGPAGALDRFAGTHLPLFALLGGGLLSGADQAGQGALQAAGLSYSVLDPNLQYGTYFLARSRASRPIINFDPFAKVLFHATGDVILRMDPSQADALIQAGAEIRAITLTPKPLPTMQSGVVTPVTLVPDPAIQGMIDQVTEPHIYTYDRQLAGELPVWVDQSSYIIPTRYTYSGLPIQKTTHFVYQHMQNLGMNVEYQVWNNSDNPNVIGEIPGTTNPDDIYIIGGHLDDVQGGPGADDNASGSVATLIAADILSQYQWGCTLRFAFWTGEEQGLLGSEAYAQRSYQQGENILGYLNLDMLAWNTLSSPPYINLFYSTHIPASHQLALLFQDVIDTYNIDLLTRIGYDIWGSDHNSFWDYGYSSILAIEDDIGGDFNPYYHKPQDTPAHTDPVYFTNFVKASVGTFAHLSGCLVRHHEGHLEGHVTHAGNATPIEGAVITAYDSQGEANPVLTSSSGYYTLSLPADTYTVTASANGFVPAEVSGVEIISNTTTTQDFALVPACDRISGLDFTWAPPQPMNGNPITFTVSASGTLPIDFQWDFGDSITTTGESVTHTYVLANTYSVVLSAENACDAQQVSMDIVVLQRMWELFIPQLLK